MSTNYYYRYNICPHCGRYEEIHVGKSAVGWQPSFRGYIRDEEYDAEDAPDIRSLKDWETFFESHPGVFVDEYGDEVDLKEFLEWARKAAKDPDLSSAWVTVRFPAYYPSWIDDEGVTFCGYKFS